MPTLHIEHAITDFDAWDCAFNRFADARRRAGVRAQRVQRPVGDPAYIVVDLDFRTRGEAEAFLRFLRSQVWGVPENSPALAGDPQAMILEPVSGAAGRNGGQELTARAGVNEQELRAPRWASSSGTGREHEPAPAAGQGVR